MAKSEKKNEIVRQNQEGHEALVQQVIGRIPKATHRQSIQSVMRAIEVNADKEAPESKKSTAAVFACKVVGNSNSMDLADRIDEGIAIRNLLDKIQNQ